MDETTFTKSDELSDDPSLSTPTHDDSTPQINGDKIAVPVMAAPTPTAPVVVEAKASKQADPITLVLQWLTYAFWGWFAIAMLWLSFVSFMFFTDSSSQDDWSSVVAYPIAAVAVLFLMASITDFFYSRLEPAHKTGIATAIMVIHTVIFALCGVGLIVGIVFTLIQMVLDTGAQDMLRTTLYTGLVGVVVYLILIARTTMVATFKRLPKVATVALGGIAAVFVVLCIVGPVMRSLETKQDRQIESVLPSVDSSIRAYVQENDKLPASLDVVTIQDTDLYSSRSVSSIQSDTKDLLSKKAIEYTANTKPASTRLTGYTTNNRVMQQGDTNGYRSTTFYYQLCVTYKAQKGSGVSTRSDYDDQSTTDADADADADADSAGASLYSSYISTYSHKEGRQCYDLQVNNSKSLSESTTN